MRGFERPPYLSRSQVPLRVMRPKLYSWLTYSPPTSIRPSEAEVSAMSSPFEYVKAGNSSRTNVALAKGVTVALLSNCRALARRKCQPWPSTPFGVQVLMFQVSSLVERLVFPFIFPLFFF